jgi:hypothetical protein
MSNEAAVRQTDAIARPESFEGLLQMADTLVKSGFLPSAIKTAPQAAAIMVAGREVGLTGMQSFRELYVVNGQVGMSTRLIVAFFKQFGGHYLFLERNPQTCTVRLIGPNGDEHDHTMTRAEADAMGITREKNKETGQQQEKFNWRANPTGMLSNNTIKGAIRLWFPECLLNALGPMQMAEPERVEVVEAEVIEQEPQDEQGAESDSGNGHNQEQATGKPHWSSDVAKLQEFKDKAAEYYGLSIDSVNEAMGNPANYATMADAKGAISHWVTEQMRAGKVAS